MKNKFRKIMTAAVSVVGAISMLGTQAMANTYSTDGEQLVPITATVPSSYMVSIPASLALEYNETTTKYEGTYTIGAKGALATDDVVFVRPETTTVNMTGVKTGNAANATLTQSDKTWGAHGDSTINSTSYTNKNGTVVADFGNNIDTFTGGVTFTFGTEFAPSAVGDTYKGAEILSLIKKYAGKQNFAVYVKNGTENIWYIGDGMGTKRESSAEAELVANAEDSTNDAYIAPLDTYSITEINKSDSGANAGACINVTFEKQ